MNTIRINDAIPSWSGYNYQGKITLLATLIEINNTVLQQIKLDDSYFVELEKVEDFIIYINGEIKSLNQVKAYIYADTYGKFTEAMKKLKATKFDLAAHSATCLLCIPNDIRNWNATGNEYRNDIVIYKPHGACVTVQNAPSLIKDELKKLLDFNQKNTEGEFVENLYLKLCNFLDEKITAMHIQGNNRKYNILMADLHEFILTEHASDEILEKLKLKEKIYLYFANELDEIKDKFCGSYCINQNAGHCQEDIYNQCSVKIFLEHLVTINIWEYVKFLNPHISSWENPLTVNQNLSFEKIKELILPIMNHSMPTIVTQEDDYIYCATSPQVYRLHGEKVIPTLLSLKKSTLYPKLIEEKLANIKKNTFIMEKLAGQTITADTNGLQHNTDKDSFLYSGKDTPNSITGKSSIQIVHYEEICKTLKKN